MRLLFIVVFLHAAISCVGQYEYFNQIMGPTDDGQFERTADILVIDGDYITWGAGNFEPGGQYFLREINS